MNHTFDTEIYGKVNIKPVGEKITVSHKIDNIYREDVTRPLFSDGYCHYWIVFECYYREVTNGRYGWYFPTIGADCLTAFATISKSR